MVAGCLIALGDSRVFFLGAPFPPGPRRAIASGSEMSYKDALMKRRELYRFLASKRCPADPPAEPHLSGAPCFALPGSPAVSCGL